jgi:hypothetical protein
VPAVGVVNVGGLNEQRHVRGYQRLTRLRHSQPQTDIVRQIVIAGEAGRVWRG